MRSNPGTPVTLTFLEIRSICLLKSLAVAVSADAVSQAIIGLLTPHKDRVKTLTFDNGSEFVRHEKVGESLKADTYFAHPYSSWERGINENTNGLLRQFFPKKTDFKTISWKQIKDAVDNLNNRPRKTRGYLTPNQLFNDTFVPLV